MTLSIAPTLLSRKCTKYIFITPNLFGCKTPQYIFIYMTLFIAPYLLDHETSQYILIIPILPGRRMSKCIFIALTLPGRKIPKYIFITPTLLRHGITKYTLIYMASFISSTLLNCKNFNITQKQDLIPATYGYNLFTYSFIYFYPTLLLLISCYSHIFSLSYLLSYLI